MFYAKVRGKGRRIQLVRREDLMRVCYIEKSKDVWSEHFIQIFALLCYSLSDYFSLHFSLNHFSVPYSC